MVPLTYVVLKTVSRRSLIADLYVVSNLEFFMLFRTGSHNFGATNTGECTIFHWPSTSGLKTEVSFPEKTV